MSSATVTPCLVTLGLPQPLSGTALRPRGPRVLRTARASLETPLSSFWRASSLYASCFAPIHASPFRVVRSDASSIAGSVHGPPLDVGNLPVGNGEVGSKPRAGGL